MPYPVSMTEKNLIDVMTGCAAEDQ